ncbi:hypothetical protein Tco_0995812 [Tanacetum coccineum]
MEIYLDHVKSISTAKANSSAIRRIGSGPHTVSNTQYNSLSSVTVPFPSRLHGYYYDDWKEGDHERKNLAGTLIDILIFVGNLGFLIINDMDITSGVMLGMSFCKQFVSGQKIMEKFAHGD